MSATGLQALQRPKFALTAWQSARAVCRREWTWMGRNAYVFIYRAIQVGLNISGGSRCSDEQLRQLCMQCPEGKNAHVVTYHARLVGLNNSGRLRCSSV